MLERILVGFLAVVMLAGAAIAGPNEDDLAAYSRGAHAEAVKWLMLAAE